MNQFLSEFVTEKCNLYNPIETTGETSVEPGSIRVVEVFQTSWPNQQYRNRAYLLKNFTCQSNEEMFTEL